MIVWDVDKGVFRRANTSDYREALYILLQLIEPGYVTSYGDLAKLLGVNPRFIGYLLKTNDKPIVIPCHRVVRSNGDLGGYSLGGKEFKKKLLMLEGVVFSGERVSRDCLKSLYSLLAR